MKKSQIIQLVLLSTLLASCKVTPYQSTPAEEPDYYDTNLYYTPAADSCVYPFNFSLNLNIYQLFYNNYYLSYSPGYYKKFPRTGRYPMPPYVKTHFIIRGGFGLGRSVAS